MKVTLGNLKKKKMYAYTHDSCLALCQWGKAKGHILYSQALILIQSMVTYHHKWSNLICYSDLVYVLIAQDALYF